jgi:hypothetical protein
VLTLALVVLTLARPPAAVADTGAARVPLTISSWCWEARCGAPIARARRVITIRRGAVLVVRLRFAPTAVALAVGGVRVAPAVHGATVSWRVKRAGGLSLTATGERGFVTYVGRIALRR